MVAQLELEGILGLLSGFHFTSDNVHSPQLQPLLQAQRNISECFAPNHTNVHLTVRHWGCSTCVWSRFYNIWKMTGLTKASKIELNVNPDTLGRKKKYIFWFNVVFFFFFPFLAILQEVAWNTDTYLFKARDWITSDTFRLTDKTKDAQFITESAGKLYELGFNKKTNK